MTSKCYKVSTALKGGVLNPTTNKNPARQGRALRVGLRRLRAGGIKNGGGIFHNLKIGGVCRSYFRPQKEILNVSVTLEWREA